jgi:hypothetical protein
MSLNSSVDRATNGEYTNNAQMPVLRKIESLNNH